MPGHTSIPSLRLRAATGVIVAAALAMAACGSGSGLPEEPHGERSSKLGLSPPTVTQRSAQLTNLYDAYSPSVLWYAGAARMWLSGWATSSDSPRDRIFFSWLDGESWTTPAEVLGPIDFQVADPTVVQAPGHSEWLFMYYTALPRQYVDGAWVNMSCEATVHPNCFESNWVGWASSVDGGATWTDRGILVGQWNGLDDYGAWSPSAVVVMDEIWLYYFANSPGDRLYRTRVRANGWEIIDTQYVNVEGGNPYRNNPDVQFWNDEFIMLANNGDLNEVWRYRSSDGLNFSSFPQDNGSPLMSFVSRPGAICNTPTYEYVDPTHFSVYFGYSESGVLNVHSVQKWTFQDP